MEISKLFGKLPKGRRKRMEIYLLNDNVNSFDHVIQSLTDSLLVDGHGECSIYSGFAPEIYILYATFQKLGLDVQIREYKPKRK